MTEFYDATPKQKMKIAQLAQALGSKEPIEEKKMSMGEAGRLIREMEGQVRLKRNPPRRIRIHWKFDADFEESFLGIWWDINPTLYSEIWHEDITGSDMILELGRINPELHQKFYQMALQERQSR